MACPVLVGSVTDPTLSVTRPIGFSADGTRLYASTTVSPAFGWWDYPGLTTFTVEDRGGTVDATDGGVAYTGDIGPDGTYYLNRTGGVRKVTVGGTDTALWSHGLGTGTSQVNYNQVHDRLDVIVSRNVANTSAFFTVDPVTGVGTLEESGLANPWVAVTASDGAVWWIDIADGGVHRWDAGAFTGFVSLTVAGGGRLIAGPSGDVLLVGGNTVGSPQTIHLDAVMAVTDLGCTVTNHTTGSRPTTANAFDWGRGFSVFEAVGELWQWPPSQTGWSVGRIAWGQRGAWG